MGERTTSAEYDATIKKVAAYKYNLLRMGARLDRLIDGLVIDKDYSYDKKRLVGAGVPASDIIAVPPLVDKFLHSATMYYNKRSIRNLRAFEILTQTMSETFNRKQVAEQHLKRVTSTLNKEMQSAATERRSNVASQRLDPANIPAKISTGKSSFTNPYHAGNNSKYAGHPDGYALSSPMLAIYEDLKRVFNRNGVPGFSVCYAARIDKHINFAFVGVGGKFIWRKYDVGGGSGQNWIYLDGNKMKTSDFMSLPPAKQDALVKAL